MEELRFPKCDYHLEESDPDVVVLRRQDGTLVARFSARGATKEGIVEAAEEDYRELIRAHPNPLLGRKSEGSSSS
jgi:broad-specificity NMP kinase